MPEFDIVAALKDFAMRLHAQGRDASNACVVRRVADNIYTMAEHLHAPVPDACDPFAHGE